MKRYCRIQRKVHQGVRAINTIMEKKEISLTKSFPFGFHPLPVIFWFGTFSFSEFLFLFFFIPLNFLLTLFFVFLLPSFYSLSLSSPYFLPSNFLLPSSFFYFLLSRLFIHPLFTPSVIHNYGCSGRHKQK
jgi:hypothetical protein